MTWQPIETAPKDGTRVLGVDADVSIEIMFFNRFDEWDLDDDADWLKAGMDLEERKRNGGYWYSDHRYSLDAEHGSIGDSPFFPTHWMPLPEPPEVTA